MTRTKTPSPAACLHEQTVRHHCRALKMPTVAGQFETLAQAAIREGHGHVQYLDALLTAEIEERERKGVVRRIQEARLPRVKTLAEFDFQQSSVSAARIADLAAGGYIGRSRWC
jgi:DNA replication protein DnaC